jgi:hypothetical protein
MDPIYTFGYKLAELTNQKEFAGIGLLCLAIKASGKPFTNLGYEDFREVIINHLPKQLERTKQTNSQYIVAEMMKTLNQHQSIFTLSLH